MTLIKQNSRQILSTVMNYKKPLFGDVTLTIEKDKRITCYIEVTAKK